MLSAGPDRSNLYAMRVAMYWFWFAIFVVSRPRRGSGRPSRRWQSPRADRMRPNSSWLPPSGQGALTRERFALLLGAIRRCDGRPPRVAVSAAAQVLGE